MDCKCPPPELVGPELAARGDGVGGVCGEDQSCALGRIYQAKSLCRCVGGYQKGTVVPSARRICGRTTALGWTACTRVCPGKGEGVQPRYRSQSLIKLYTGPSSLSMVSGTPRSVQPCKTVSRASAHSLEPGGPNTMKSSR